MDKIALAWAFAFVAAGCGVQAIDDNHGYGYGYDMIAPDGTRLRNNPPVTAFDQTEMQRLVVEPYHEVEKCVQVFTGGPLVVAVPNDGLSGRAGTTYLDTGLVVVTDNAAQDGLDTRLHVGGPFSTLRHEYVHYLLAASGFPDELNRTHQSPLFLDCSGVAQ